MKKNTPLIVFFYLITVTGLAQQSYTPSTGNLENRNWFEAAKLGMFIHFGVYTQLNDSNEAWTMRKYSIADYEKVAEKFDPEHFDAKEIVATANRLGFRFITITTKHHDGFCLFDSKYTSWTIIHYGKYRKDIIKELTNECHKQGIKIHFYYSLLDWHHPDFVFYKEDGGVYDKQLPNPQRNEQKYFQYMENQLTELLTNYDTVDGIWFDGYWSKNKQRYPFEKIYSLIHRLQPACLIHNNHDMFYINGEDKMGYALYTPFPQNDYDNDPILKQMPLEAMDMASDKWGYYSKQISKPATVLIQNTVKVVCNNATFLLNTGLLPDGSLDRNFIDTMNIVHAWLKENGETIYGTRAGEIPVQEWGGSTQKGNKLYIHLINIRSTELQLPVLSKKVKRIIYFNDKNKVGYSKNDIGILLQIDTSKQNKIDTIIEVDFE